MLGRRLGERLVRGVITPQVRQAEPTECGIAALAIVMGHHGVHVPLETLRARAGSTRFGISARRLLAIAREFGFTAKGFSSEIGGLAELGLPLIAHFRFSHYLVVERVGSRLVRVNDPIDGPRLLSIAEFSAGFTGVVLKLDPAASTTPRGRAFSPGRELARRFRPVAARVALAGGLSAAGAACLTVAAGIGGAALERLVEHRPAFSLTALAAVLAIATIGITMASEWVATAAGIAAAWRHTVWVLGRLARLPPGYFAGRLQPRLVGKAQAALSFADRAGALTGVQLPALAVLAAAMLWFGRGIGAVIVALAAAEMALIVAVGLWRGGRIARGESGQLPVVGVPSAVLRAPELWQVGGTDAALFSRLASQHAFALAKGLPAGERQAALDSVRTLLHTGRLLAAVVLTAFFVPSGGISPGGAAALIAVSVGIGGALDRFSQGFTPERLRRAMHELGDISNAVPMAQSERRHQMTSPVGRLVLSEVVWAPIPGAVPVIAGVTFEVAPGRAVAICGASGSGKSMLAQLICGELQPSAGTVEVDGAAASSLPLGTVILVDKRSSFIAASVRDNLRLGLNIDDPLLTELLDAFGVGAAFARRGGLDLVLSEQARQLSASERYRLAVARASLRQPSILVLDDFFDTFDAALAARICELVRLSGMTLVAMGRRVPECSPIDHLVRMPAVVQRSGP